jgi:hypothetical protein
MLFVIPVYAGLAGTWATVFNWISFALFLPILFFSAVPFYRGAWNSLKYKVINVDLPTGITHRTFVIKKNEDLTNDWLDRKGFKRKQLNLSKDNSHVERKKSSD